MDLKGAEIRNIVELCQDMGPGQNKEKPLRVNIPHYQRPYKWDETRIKNLIDDYNRNLASDSLNDEYFVGSVVLVGNSSDGDSRLDVIDGQQRITTVFLLNYIRFLLLRARTEDIFNRRAQSSIVGTLEQLIDCYTRLLGGNSKKTPLTSFAKELDDAMEEVQDLCRDAADKAWTDFMRRYRDYFGLPERVFDDTYASRYKAALNKFLMATDLALAYSRSSYNTKLKEALSSTVVRADNSTPPSLIVEYEGEDEVVKQYKQAIECEFEALCRYAISDDDKPIQAVKKLIEYIDEMIKKVKFCVILTGSENDAYTLFEVLNDRAMEVDDLDLIKNLFLRQYCNTSDEDEDVIDRTVSEIDVQWGERIFKPGIPPARSKMISYLGTVFLTADSNITTNKNERFRKGIEEKYFGQVYSNKPYTSKDIKRDITIYQMISILLEKYRIQASKQNIEALKAEASNSDSITYKALLLLNALGQGGVMAAIVNLTLRIYLDKMEIEKKDPLDLDNYREFLDRLKSNDSHKDDLFATIHKWSFELWKASLLSKNYEHPRTIARSIIEEVNATKNDIEKNAIAPQVNQEMVDSFNSWVSDWKYSSSSVLLKTKILFCELLSTVKSQDGKRLTFKVFFPGISNSNGTIQLDHLDARNPPSAYAKFHFLPEDPNVHREDYIDDLGNMMILTGSSNNDKGTEPLEEALEYYRVMCPNGHWLIDEIRFDLEYKGCHRMVYKGDEQKRVPTDKFFTRRKENLRRYFLTVLQRATVDDTEATIV